MIVGMLRRRFHPLKSGRNTAQRTAAQQCRSRFHPLKSGRNVCRRCWKIWHRLVSIPSSRVGTSLTFCRKRAVFAVSIPSSRVGTALDGGEVAGTVKFPSPQVGSELKTLSRIFAYDPPFPSPQVGSERKSPVADGGVAVSFHPLKSGRNPGVYEYRLITPGFHPLKSGRNQTFALFPALFAIVSIPSSRVGTFTLRSSESLQQ